MTTLVSRTAATEAAEKYVKSHMSAVNKWLGK